MDIILILVRVFFGFGIILIFYKFFEVFRYKSKKISEYHKSIMEEETNKEKEKEKENSLGKN